MRRRRKRRRRSAEETRELLERARERGLTHRELADELGVHPNTVGYWARREREQAPPVDTRASVSLVPVRVTRARVDSTPRDEDDGHDLEFCVEGALSGRDVRLRIPRGARARDIHAVLSALAEATC